MLEPSAVSHRQAVPVVQRVRLRARERQLTKTQVNAVHVAMQLFVEEDLANGLPTDVRQYCDACEQARPAAGFIRYGRYSVCNTCAVEYELAMAQGRFASPGQFVRGKHFGEIPALAWASSVG